jgi:hypothetical protein
MCKGNAMTDAIKIIVTLRKECPEPKSALHFSTTRLPVATILST